MNFCRILIVMLLKPWRGPTLLASRPAGGRRMAFTASGLLMVPLALGVINLLIALPASPLAAPPMYSFSAPNAGSLGAPQQGLMAALGKGIVQVRPMTWRIRIILLAGWLGGGVLAGATAVYLGGAILRRLLGNSVLGLRIAAYQSFLLPLNVAVAFLWLCGKLLGGSLILFLPLILLTVWTAVVFAAIGFAGAKAAQPSCRVPPLLCAAANFVLAVLLALAASNLAWLPIQLVRPLWRE